MTPAHTPDPEDERDRVLAGDSAALDGWYRRHQPAVYRLCLGFLADGAEAEDATQDAMLRLLDRLSIWDGQRSFAAWRNALVLNLCRDRRRQTARRRRAERAAFERQPAAALPRPEDELHAAEVRQVLERALRSLPEREREAFVLRDLEGNPTVEVAAVMGLAESTVRSLTTLARRRLRGLLATSLGTDLEVSRGS